MTELSWWWTSDDTGDGQTGGYSVSQIARFYRMMTQGTQAGGVWPDFESELAVTGTTTPVQVGTGGALVYGFGYSNDASENVVIPTPAANTRIDRIVLRLVWASEQVRIHRIAGTEGSSAPALTQNAGTTWDIPLAQVSVTTGGVITITDERQFLSIVAPGGVTNAKIADDAVTSLKIADGAVTRGKIATNAISEAKLDNGAVTSDKIAGHSVNESKIGTGAVTSDKIGSSAVTEAKIQSNAATNSKLGQLSAGNIKGRGLNSGTGNVQDLSPADLREIVYNVPVQTGNIADNAVDDTKVGDRVPQFYRRQGHVAGVNWAEAGTTNFAPGAVRMQAGATEFIDLMGYETRVITFPVPFSQTPLIFVTIGFGTSIYDAVAVSSGSASGFTVNVVHDPSQGIANVRVNWLAIGPE